MSEKTTISIKKSTLAKLKTIKICQKESYDEVIERIIKILFDK